MTERTTGHEERYDDSDRASKFERAHVLAPNDYESYCEKARQEWETQALDDLASGRPIKPMWLRRNAYVGSEFGAHIDCVSPRGSEQTLAAIDVSSDGGDPIIEVWMPREDGSGEPVVATAEHYSRESLLRAIDYVESRVSIDPARIKQLIHEHLTGNL